MAIALDERPALLVVDLQQGTISNPLVHPAAEILARAAGLVSGFQARSLPVVFACVDGTPAGRNEYGGGGRRYPADFTALAPELSPRPDDLRLTRSAWSAFAGTDLDADLRSRGVTQVVIVGLATSFGIESTARQAYDLGYNVVLVVDAMSDMRAESHEHSVSRVFPLLGQTGSTAEVAELLS